MTEAKKAASKSRSKSPAKTAKAATTKAAAPKPPPATKSVAKPATQRAAKPAGRPKRSAAISQEQRRNYVEVAAYYIAERRGFTPGDPMQDWVEAESEIDRLLAEGLLGS